MVNDNRNLVNFALVFAGFLTWLAAYLLFELLAGHIGFVNRGWNSQAMRNIIPILFGIGAFAALRFNTGAVTFTDDVITELKKVSWPEPKMTWGLTWRVCIILVIAGIVVAGFDMIWAYMINQVVKG